MESSQYVVIGQAEDFLPQIGRVVKFGDQEIAVFRTSDHRWFALDNHNPHPKGGPLAEAILSGHYIYDPLYDWKIELATGNVQAPDSGNVRTYPVREREGRVELCLTKR